MQKQTLCCCAIVCALAMVPPAVKAQEPGGMPEMKASGGMASAEAPAKVYGGLMKEMSEEIIGAAEAMPADKYSYAPTAGNFTGVRTFGGQVQHLIGANYGFFSDFGLPMPVTREQIKAMKTKEQLVQGLKDSYVFAARAVATITPANAFVVVGTGEEAGTRAGTATFCLAHANDHYGQMVEYLRMNGIVPPASAKK